VTPSSLRRVGSALTVVALLAMGGATTGCERHEGPAAKAGEKIDKATDKVSDAINPKGSVDKAGRKIDRALKD